MAKIVVTPKHNVYTAMMFVTALAFIIGIVVNMMKLNEIKMHPEPQRATFRQGDLAAAPPAAKTGDIDDLIDAPVDVPANNLIDDFSDDFFDNDGF